MNFSVLLASLKAALLSKLLSLGGALLSGLATIGIGFGSDMKGILVDTLQAFHDAMDAALSAGKSEIEAIEEGATVARNTFCNDMEKDGAKEADAIITLITSSLKAVA